MDIKNTLENLFLNYLYCSATNAIMADLDIEKLNLLGRLRQEVEE